MGVSQVHIPWQNKDFTYIDLYKKSYEYHTDPEEKQNVLYVLRSSEALRDFHIGSLKQINHLIQFDNKPNLDLKQARSEIFKISVSFDFRRKIVYCLQQS